MRKRRCKRRKGGLTRVRVREDHKKWIFVRIQHVELKQLGSNNMITPYPNSKNDLAEER